MIIANVIKYLEQLYPKELAFEKDPIGFHIGNVNHNVNKVLVTLDVTEAVVKEAIAVGANLIIAHHPFIYRPLSTINTDTPKGKVIELCLKHDLNIYAMHTNYDIAPGGMNDCLAEALELTGIKPLIATEQVSYSKIAIYVPLTHVEVIREALALAGVGRINNYSHCTFMTTGIGSFNPLPNSQPYIGQAHQLELVEEGKVEGVVKTDQVTRVVECVKKVHPYEEMVYDCYLLKVPTLGAKYGLGRIGQVKGEVIASDYIGFVKKALGISNARFIGNLQKKVMTVAVMGGSGSSYITKVKAKNADLYITGDVGFHEGQDAIDLGLNILDVGHHVESMMKQHVTSILNQALGEIAVASTLSTEPFQFV